MTGQVSGQEIRKRREKIGLSQANLCRITGIRQATLSNWEREKSNPERVDLTRVLAAIARVEAGEFPDGMLLRNHGNSNRHARRGVPGDRAVNSSVAGSKEDSLQVKRVFGTADCSIRGRTKAKPSAPRCISFFAGLGGMSYGFREAGFDIVGFVEIDSAARRTFSLNFPEAIALAGDIRKVDSEAARRWRDALGPIDVMCGGPPCQGFSLAGKRDVGDPRNYLFRDYLRIADVLRPRAIIMENVRLLTSMTDADGSRVIDNVLSALNQIGYYSEYRELNAQDYGVPQFRERVIIIAVPSGRGHPVGLIPEPSHSDATQASLLESDRKPLVTFRDATADLECLESGDRSEADQHHWAVKHPDRVIRWLENVPEGKSAHENEDPSLRPPSGYNTTYKRLIWDEPSSTIGTTFGMISACRTVHPTSTRSLTIREALRLQTFPDSFQLTGNAGQMRTQIGNAVPPKLAEAIAAHLAEKVLSGD